MNFNPTGITRGYDDNSNSIFIFLYYLGKNIVRYKNSLNQKLYTITTFLSITIINMDINFEFHDVIVTSVYLIDSPYRRQTSHTYKCNIISKQNQMQIFKGSYIILYHYLFDIL